LLRYHEPVLRKSTLLLATLPLAAQDFHLKDQDRVVFFGDSITQQMLYTTFTETFAVTRFPLRRVTFVHSGWGGDRVTGGAGGGIDVRMQRDISAYGPSVITIMLGMNDGRVRAFDQQIFEIYKSGYTKIIKDLRAANPKARITAIRPSPYDDVTRPPLFAGGYNEVLIRYGDFVQELAAAESLMVADLNTPVTAMLSRAKSASLEDARKIVPDRVHPAAPGHLIMTAALLKAWNAPGVVSSVEIDAAARRVSSIVRSSVTGTRFGSAVTWTQLDEALPMPVDMADPVMALAVNSSDFQDSLNRQIVKVTGLPPGPHTLRIDGSEVATHSAGEWSQGVNLAAAQTPMWEQASRVHAATLEHNAIHFARWRTIEVPFEDEKTAGMQPALAALDSLERELVGRQRALAAPVAHRFELTPGGSSFKPLFNGSDLSGWHISKTNHHGLTHGWAVENATITGTQDKPGHGGILLTDRTFRTFEVSLEINPDFGCDGGLFLRSSEKGEAYQVLLDNLDGGAIGGIYGERLKGVETFVPKWQKWYKRGAWNHLRARIEGDVPHIQVWLNGIRITDWTDNANHAAAGATSGMIAVQVHAGNRWIPGGKHRFRNLMVRELP
jgi:lysophospholipase L1-like esterase